MEVKNNLQEEYNKQYENGLREWRMLGAKRKAKNIIDITVGRQVNKVLDIGSGDGSVLHWLDNSNFCNDITSVEISDSGIEEIKSLQLKSVKQVIKFDGYHLPFEDDFFDVAMCSHVMEHVEFPRKLIREIKRVSKFQVFEVPIDFSFKVDKKVEHFLSYGHINIYTPQTFRFLLKSEGLEIVNYLNRLYSKEVSGYIDKKQPASQKIKNNLKRFLWHVFPFLMAVKPNTTTVLCKKGQENLQIMK